MGLGWLGRGIALWATLGLLVVRSASAGEVSDERIRALETQLEEAQKRIRRLERAPQRRGEEGASSQAAAAPGKEPIELLLETLYKQGLIREEDYAALRSAVAARRAAAPVTVDDHPPPPAKAEAPSAGIAFREQEPGDDLVGEGQSLSHRLTTKYRLGKGIVVRSDDGSFDAIISNRLQVRYTNTDQHDEPTNQDTSSFSIPRATTLIYGHVWHPTLAYRLQVVWAPTVQLGDAYLQWQPRSWAGARAGQYRVPFSRQQLTSSGTLQFVDRSFNDGFFAFGRDRGVSVLGSALGEKQDELQWELGIFNGNGVKASNNENSDNLGAARVLWMPLGSFDYYIESDVRDTQSLRFGIGGAGAYNSQAESTGKSGTRPSILEDNRLLQWFGTGTQDRFDIPQATADFHLKYRGLSALGDFQWAEANPKTQPTKRARGFNVQTGYFLIPHHLELAGRFASVSRDLSTSRSGLREWGGVVNWFFLAHSLKLQLDVRDVVDEDPRQPDRQFQEYRLQLQTVF